MFEDLSLDTIKLMREIDDIRLCKKYLCELYILRHNYTKNRNILQNIKYDDKKEGKKEIMTKFAKDKHTFDFMVKYVPDDDKEWKLKEQLDDLSVMADAVVKAEKEVDDEEKKKIIDDAKKTVTENKRDREEILERLKMERLERERLEMERLDRERESREEEERLKEEARERKRLENEEFEKELDEFIAEYDTTEFEDNDLKELEELLGDIPSDEEISEETSEEKTSEQLGKELEEDLKKIGGGKNNISSIIKFYIDEINKILKNNSTLNDESKKIIINNYLKILKILNIINKKINNEKINEYMKNIISKINYYKNI